MNPALGAAPISAHLQEYGVYITLADKIQDPRTVHAHYLFCLIGRHPTGVPPDRSRKVAMLATNQAVPIFDYEPLEGIMKESEFPLGKDAKEVSIEVSEDVAEVERGNVHRLRDHPV